MEGAATCFFAFVGFDTIACVGEMLRFREQRVIPPFVWGVALYTSFESRSTVLGKALFTAHLLPHTCGQDAISSYERVIPARRTLSYFDLMLRKETKTSLKMKKKKNMKNFGGGNSSAAKCPPPNWKVGCSIHSHWVNCRSAPWARAFTSTAPARSTIQASACRYLPSTKLTKKRKLLSLLLSEVNLCGFDNLLRVLSDYIIRAVTTYIKLQEQIQEFPQYFSLEIIRCWY